MLIPHLNTKTEISSYCHLLLVLLLVAFAGESLALTVNTPAIITGDSSASVNKLVDQNADGMLVASGTLAASDPDPGESSFVPSVKMGVVGRIYINSWGQWYYVADASHVAIVGLAPGQSLIDTVTVSTVDGTQHDVNVTILGADNPNSPAIIGGDLTGSVTAGVDPDGDGLLEISGSLTITDADLGEASFIPRFQRGAYGFLYLNSSGYWYYAVDSRLTALQNLASTGTYTDTITVSSVDGTTNDVVITIAGAEEAGGLTLSWIAPAEREDGRALSMAEIAGYRVYYGVSPGTYTNEYTVDGGSTMSVTLPDLLPGNYFLVITTVDTDGRESAYSLEVARTI